ncbi:hypothetical protein UFOVP1309_66 [uncultured Caudovirales phage]|uniref:Uncharacterized protein n=1 Tax=uncultured Caudovirales phage TaxID=2100421 RepID=A0A6J5RVW7_9CAUD|nr:hypothetical protein UFOVP1309_66 [uncultured Caudovirales phage]
MTRFQKILTFVYIVVLTIAALDLFNWRVV